jgi:hypothetical protein
MTLIENFCFDIESVPLDDSMLDLMIPPFNPDEIKTGNMGAEKAKEKIDRLREEHFKTYRRRAALSPLTGQVAAIGIIGPEPDERAVMIDSNETELIKTFFTIFAESIRSPRLSHWIGFCIETFDLPFIIRRAWRLGVPIPAGLSTARYISHHFTDLAASWRLSDFRGPVPSLAELANFFGLPTKTGKGADFAELLRYDHAAAREYLTTDLVITWQLAERLGAFHTEPEPGYAEPIDEPEPEPEPAEPELRFF